MIENKKGKEKREKKKELQDIQLSFIQKYVAQR